MDNPRLHTGTLLLTVNDVGASVAWYRNVMGFEVSAADEGSAMVMAGDLKLYLLQDDFQKGSDREKGTAFRVYLETDGDVDEMAAGIQARGGTLESEPATQPWGIRVFGLADPDGFKFSVGRPVSES